MNQFGSGPGQMLIALVLWWCLILGGVIVVLKALWRFVRAQERIAVALETLAGRKPNGQ
jgi:hypothetical protein